MLTSSQQTGVLPGNGGNYAVNAITDLFFSWARFYEENNPGRHADAEPRDALQRTERADVRHQDP